MAKDNSNNGGKSKVKFLYAEFEGSDASIETLAQTFAKALQPPARVIMRTLPPPAAGDAPAKDGKDAEAGLFTEVDGQIIEEADVAEDGGAPSVDRTPKKPRSPRKRPSYEIVKDLDLRPLGKQTLREFFLEKKPSDQQEQVTAIVYYLNRVLERSNVNANDIFSGFKEVGEPSPTDIVVIARNVETRKGWLDPADSNNIRITVAGQNFVEHDLPHDKAPQPAK